MEREKQHENYDAKNVSHRLMRVHTGGDETLEYANGWMQEVILEVRLSEQTAPEIA